MTISNSRDALPIVMTPDGSYPLYLINKTPGISCVHLWVPDGRYPVEIEASQVERMSCKCSYAHLGGWWLTLIMTVPNSRDNLPAVMITDGQHPS